MDIFEASTEKVLRICAGEGGEKLSDEKPLQVREGIGDIADMELSGINNGLFGFFSVATDFWRGGMAGGADDSYQVE